MTARTVEKVGPCFAPVQITTAAEMGGETAKLPSEDARRMRLLPVARTGLIKIDLVSLSETQSG